MRGLRRGDRGGSPNLLETTASCPHRLPDPAAEESQNQPPVEEARGPREERVRAIGNVRYVPPDQPDPDPAEWEYRKTSKKGNRVYVRRPVTPEMVRKLTLEALSQIKPEVKEIVVKVADRPTVKMDGKVHEKFTEILDLAAQRMEILMVGPAGCGKSHLAEQIAKALGLRFGSISCSAGMSEGQITGRLIPTGEGGRFEYQRSQFVAFYEEGGVFLLDEIDAADANVLLVINQALANGHLPVPNRLANPQAKRHPEFVLLAAANTFGNDANRMYVGRNQLDDATMQRAGWTSEKIIGQLVCGWTQDERSKVGVN